MTKNQNTKSLFKNYLTGYLLSIALTLLSFFVVNLHISSAHEVISHELLLVLVIFFAFSQLIVQLMFFLHLMHESSPRWNLIFFISTFSLVLMIVIGTIWIMGNLDYNMMPAEMSNSIIKDEGIHK